MDDIAVESAVEDVIRQFADPLALFRELVQNAIDAGSREVEVRLEYDAERGLGVVSVTDWGEGMTREIIETELVRLFSSAKDADLTKIGKFGIGFVSVLAVEPELVTVETGRDGEYWRLLLFPDRSYELHELDQPMEGTEVRLYLRQERSDFDSFRVRAAEAVRNWCRFVSVPVTFDGADVRERFDLDGIVVARFAEEGTRIVAALRDQSSCQGAYFNAGLALQRSDSQWPHVEYLLDSRYLEHTIARDRILEGKNFHAAIDRLGETIETDLRAEAARALADWPSDPDRVWDWQRLCAVVRSVWGDDFCRSHVRFLATSGELVEVEEARRARNRNRLMFTRGRAHFAHAMSDDYLLLDVRPDSAPAELLQTMLGRDVPVLEDVWVHVPVAAAATDDEEALLTELDAVLHSMGASPRSVGFGEFEYPYSGLEHLMAVDVDELDTPIHRADLRALDPLAAVAHVLINRSHPLVVDAMMVARTEPEWAAYTLAKCAALHHEAVEHGHLTQALDARVALESLQRRDERVEER